MRRLRKFRIYTLRLQRRPRLRKFKAFVEKHGVRKLRNARKRRRLRKLAFRKRRLHLRKKSPKPFTRRLQRILCDTRLRSNALLLKQDIPVAISRL